MKIATATKLDKPSTYSSITLELAPEATEFLYRLLGHHMTGTSRAGLVCNSIFTAIADACEIKSIHANPLNGCVSYSIDLSKVELSSPSELSEQ